MLVIALIMVLSAETSARLELSGGTSAGTRKEFASCYSHHSGSGVGKSV